MKSITHHICEIDARHRLLFAFCIAVICYLALGSQVSLPTRVVATWDTFAGSALAATWVTIIAAEHTHIRQKARTQDLSRKLIFVFTVVAACASLFAVIFLLSSVKLTTHLLVHASLAVFAIISGWSLMHTVFALRYAHAYYGDSDDPDQHVGGLEFPNDETPDYLDFAYFSFVIGMTCQVSDVEIASKPLRRLALLHGLLSFIFNTVILALTINAVATLL